jgi:hypothetical protein
LVQIRQQELIMADNLQNAGAQDRSRINVNEEYEVRHWTEALGVTREELEKAVSEVGVSANAVREHLKKR